MSLTRRARAMRVSALPLTTGLLTALLAFAGQPIPTAANAPLATRPDSVTSFPTGSARSVSRATADQPAAVSYQTGATAYSSTSAGASLGAPVVASLELQAGRQTGYLFNASGRQLSSRVVSLKAAEADSTTRRYLKNGATYYLLSWGPLSGYWVRLSNKVTVVAPTRWKVLVMVYRKTNLDFIDAAGVTRHLEATMAASHERLMVDSIKTMPGLVKQLSSAIATQQLTVVRLDTPISSVTPLGGGASWLAPENIAADLAAYAPPGAFDSVVVMWQPWDEGDQMPSAGWGLAFPPGPSANGAAFATVTVPPPGYEWWLTSVPHPGEVFVHEWLHGVIDYYVAHGASTPALHGNVAFDYRAESGSWSRWYGDLMRQRVLDKGNGALVGISYTVWRTGTPRSSP